MKFKIEHRLGLPVPPEAIWGVISDINSWGEWNPLYTRAEGTLRIGAQLSNHAQRQAVQRLQHQRQRLFRA